MRRSTQARSRSLSACILALAACGMTTTATTADGDGGRPPARRSRPQSDIKVGMAYDVGGRGDQSFNDSAAAGLDQAVEEFGVESEEAEAEDGEAETAREERLRTFADAGYNPIIAVGFAYSASVGKVAAGVPRRQLRDHRRRQPRRRCDRTSPAWCSPRSRARSWSARPPRSSPRPATSASSAASQVPLIEKFEAGYEAGAKAVNPDIKIDVHVPDPAAGLLRLR